MNLQWKHAWLLAVLAFVQAALPAFSDAADSEDELKSAAVWLFVQYSHVAPGADGAIRVAVVGRPSFVKALRRSLEGKSTGGRPVKVAEPGTDPAPCQIVYLATDRNDELRRALGSPQFQHALTIGESDHFLDQGGAVNLFLVDGHIAFEASLEALDRNGVSISSNLLKFGQIRNRTKGPGAK